MDVGIVCPLSAVGIKSGFRRGGLEAKGIIPLHREGIFYVGEYAPRCKVTRKLEELGFEVVQAVDVERIEIEIKFIPLVDPVEYRGVVIIYISILCA